MPEQFKITTAKQVSNVRLLAGEEIIDADDIMAVGHESLAEMTAQKASTTGDKNAFDRGCGHRT